MKHNLNRRAFLQATSSAVAASVVANHGSSLFAATKDNQLSTPSADKIGWQVAIQLYTFRSGSFYDALPKIASLGVQHVEPCFFLPLDAKRPSLKTNEKLTSKLRDEMKQRMNDHGIRMSNYYAELTPDKEAARKIFDFSKEMGVKTIVSEPPPEAFDVLEQLCDEYDINLGVHNHPKGPDYDYWDPNNVRRVCQGHGKRIGACCDTGHWIRSALPAVPCLKKMEGRIVAIHLKDVAVWGKPEARDVPLGEGLAQYGDVLKELKRQNFKGVMSVEYEHQSDQLMNEVRKCLTFVETTAGLL